MKVDRTTMRLALPPVVALAFVGVLSTPLSASASLADPQQPGLVGGTTQASLLGAEAAADGTANTRVSIGAVAFPQDVTIMNGHLHTPVLLAADSVTASAAVDGASTGAGCTAELTPGVPAWLDCAITPGATPRVVVTLSDGRTATKAISLG